MHAVVLVGAWAVSAVEFNHRSGRRGPQLGFLTPLLLVAVGAGLLSWLWSRRDRPELLLLEMLSLVVAFVGIAFLVDVSHL